MTQRLFAALLPPIDVLGDLERFMEPRWDSDDWRWTSPSSWHVTLAFLGEVDEGRVERVVEALGEVRPRPLTAQLSEGLAFPDGLRAKVLGLRVISTPDAGALDALAANVRAECNRAGAAVDGARFRGHLTLGRSHRPQRAHRWLQLLDTYSSRAWSASEFALVESHLGEARPRYETVATFPLA